MLDYLKRRSVALIATIGLCVVGVLLGNWQTRRAEEKEIIAQKLVEQDQHAPLDINAALALTPIQPLPDYRNAKVRGTYVDAWTVFIDNRPMDGASGFYVITPFCWVKMESQTQTQTQSTDHTKNTETCILVLRGWHPRDVRDRGKVPSVENVKEHLLLQGKIIPRVDRVMQVGASDTIQSHAILQNLSVENMRAASKLNLLDQVLQLEKVLEPVARQNRDEVLKRNWPKPTFGADKHRAYAFQWYGLALMTVLFFVITGFRKRPNKKPS